MTMTTPKAAKVYLASLLIFALALTCLSATVQRAEAAGTNILAAGGTLNAGGTIASPSGDTTLAMQTDGNLVLYGPTSTSPNGVIWASGTSGSNMSLRQQADGNLLIYNGSNQPVWASTTQDYAGAQLVVLDYGHASIYSAAGQLLWDNKTPLYSTLPSGTTMLPGQSLRSPDHSSHLNYGTNGTLTLMQGSTVKWLETSQATSSFLRFSATGDLQVTRYSDGGISWASGTGTHPGGSLIIQNDGNLVMSQRGQTVWSFAGGPVSLVPNGGMESGGWTATANTNQAIYTSTTTPPHSGNKYLATNTSGAGGSVYTDIPLTINTRNTYCATAWVRTEGAGQGASGNFNLWLTGGLSNETSSTHYANLPNNTWTQISTCIQATTPHTNLRIQLYPDVNATTVNLDDVDVHQSLVPNGSMESGGWTATANTNQAIYTSTTTPPHSGNKYLATNTSGTGGSVYTDIPLTINTRNTYCATAWVRTEGAGQGASGNFNLWLTGGLSNETSSTHYANLPNNTWTQISTCIQATTPHTNLRIQLYPDVNATTVNLDDVDITQ